MNEKPGCLFGLIWGERFFFESLMFHLKNVFLDIPFYHIIRQYLNARAPFPAIFRGQNPVFSPQKRDKKMSNIAHCNPLQISLLQTSSNKDYYVNFLAFLPGELSHILSIALFFVPSHFRIHSWPVTDSEDFPVHPIISCDKISLHRNPSADDPIR